MARVSTAAEAADPQKKRVYAWEGSFRHANERTLTQPETRRVIRRCCRLFRVPRPRIDFLPRETRTWSEYDTKTNVLMMNYSQCNHWIACHEAAHVIVTHRFGESVQDHGPEFMAIYLRLLHEHEVAPRAALEASAKARRLKWTWTRCPK